MHIPQTGYHKKYLKIINKYIELRNLFYKVDHYVILHITIL